MHYSFHKLRYGYDSGDSTHQYACEAAGRDRGEVVDRINWEEREG